MSDIDLAEQYHVYAPRPGKVWALRVYPGGRKEFRQCKLEDLVSVAEAMSRLVAGRKVDILLSDVVCFLREWEGDDE